MQSTTAYKHAGGSSAEYCRQSDSHLSKGCIRQARAGKLVVHAALRSHRPQPCTRSAQQHGAVPQVLCPRGGAHGAWPATRPQTQRTMAYGSITAERELKLEAWHMVCIVVGASMFLCNLHRAVFTILTPAMANQFQLDLGQVGVVQSSMLFGYLAGQVPAGALSDTLGGEWVLVVCLLLWSASLMATGAVTSLAGLLASRVCFGLASACAMPGVSAMASRHVPASVKASTIACIYAFFNLGGVIGLGLTPMISAHVGWKSMLHAAGMGGVAWALAGVYLLRMQSISSPLLERQQQEARPQHAKQRQQHQHHEGSPQRTVEEQGQQAQPSRSRRISQVLALCWAHAVMGWGFFIFQSWIPLYIQHLNPEASLGDMGVLSAVPWLAALVLGAASGNIADRLIAHGWPRLSVRRLMHGITTLGCVASMLPLVTFSNVTPALACLCLTGFNSCYVCSFGGFHAYIQDVAVPGSAGKLTGLTNSCGIVMGILGNLATGWLVNATGSYTSIFVVTSVLCVLSMAVFTVVLDGKSL